MGGKWTHHRWESPAGLAFRWASPLTETFLAPEPEWPFEMLSPEGLLMHLSECEELDAYLILLAPHRDGFYDMAYVDEEGGWWWVAFLPAEELLVARRVSRQEVADRIVEEFERASED